MQYWKTTTKRGLEEHGMRAEKKAERKMNLVEEQAERDVHVVKSCKTDEGQSSHMDLKDIQPSLWLKASSIILRT